MYDAPASYAGQMATRTIATSTGPSGVILDPQRFARHARLTRSVCDPSLQRWVENYWTVSWQLPPGAAYRTSIVPLPCANLTAEYGDVVRDGVSSSGAFVTGVVSRHRFDAVLSGNGGVVGVKFRPGGLTAMTGVDASTLRDRVVPAAVILAESSRVADLRADDSQLSARLDDLVTSLGRSAWQRDDDLDRVSAVMNTVDSRTPPSSAADLADRCGLALRTLQRLCKRYVGVGPQWLIARSRVHAAIARLDDPAPVAMVDIAHDLGWFDQAHFNRDFRMIVGESPGSYRSRSISSR